MWFIGVYVFKLSAQFVIVVKIVSLSKGLNSRIKLKEQHRQIVMSEGGATQQERGLCVNHFSSIWLVDNKEQVDNCETEKP